MAGTVTRFRNKTTLAILNKFPEVKVTLTYTVGVETTYVPGQEIVKDQNVITGITAFRKDFKEKEDGFGIIEPSDVKMVVVAKTMSEDPTSNGTFLLGDEEWEIISVKPQPKELPSIYICHCRLYTGA